MPAAGASHRFVAVLPLLSVLCVVVAACGGPADVGREDADPLPFDADPMCEVGDMCAPSECRRQEFYAGPVASAGLRSSFDEGQAVFVSGLQLSLMLTPVLSANVGGEIEAGCVEVTIDHAPDPAFPEESFAPFSLVAVTLLQTDGVELRTPPIQDPFAEDLAGRHMILTIRARGASWAAELVRNVRVVDGDGYQPCDAYPVIPDRGEFSRYVEGSVVFAETTFDACDSEAEVGVVFTPDRVVDGCDINSEFTVRASRDCLARYQSLTDHAALRLNSDGTEGGLLFDEPLVCACD